MPDDLKMNIAASASGLRMTHAERRLSEIRSAANHPVRSDTDLEKASQQFESLLLNMMIREMRATIPESGLFPRSMAEDVFTSMLDEQYGDLMARSGGIGLSRMIVDQLEQPSGNPPKEPPSPTENERLK